MESKMTTLIQKLSLRKCFTVREYKTIRTAIRKLVKNRIGALPVKNRAGEIVGIISERDIVRRLNSDEFNFFSTTVNSVMTKSVISCSVNARATELMEIMTSNKIRHVPIIEEKRLLGMVSIGDVVSRLLEKYQEETKLLRDYINS